MKRIGLSLKELKDVVLSDTLREKLSQYFTLKIDSYVAVITPAQAVECLKGLNARKKILGQVKKYSRMMADSKWEISSALSFDFDGNLLNGQHRLSAVIDCGIPQAFLIITGLPPSAANCEDDGKPRRAADIYENKCGVTLDPRWIETLIRRILLAYTSGKEKEGLVYAIDNYNKFKPALDLVTEIWPKRPKHIKAPIIGAFARAFVKYKNEPGKLKKISQIAKRFEHTNWNMETDRPLIELRKWTDQMSGKAGCTGGAWSQAAYGIAASVIDAVLEGKVMKELAPPAADPFGTVSDISSPLYLLAAV